jgi:hypothetical protein
VVLVVGAIPFFCFGGTGTVSFTGSTLEAYGLCVDLPTSVTVFFTGTVGFGASGAVSLITQVGVIGVFFSGISGSHF